MLRRGDRRYQRAVAGSFQDLGDDHDRRHELSSAAIDLDTLAVSDAYPAGAAIGSINDVVVLPQ